MVEESPVEQPTQPPMKFALMTKKGALNLNNALGSLPGINEDFDLMNIKLKQIYKGSFF